MSGPTGNWHSRCASMLLPLRLVSRKLPDADLKVDLLGRDFQLQLGRVAAIAFAGDVLRVASGERKIIFRRRNSGGARGKGKSDAADKWMDGFHYDPTFSTSNIHQDCKRSPRGGGKRRVAGVW